MRSFVDVCVYEWRVCVCVCVEGGGGCVRTIKGMCVWWRGMCV